MSRTIREQMIRDQDARLAASAHPESDVDRAISMWTDLITELRAVIGDQGSRALYRRTLHLVDPAAAEHAAASPDLMVPLRLQVRALFRDRPGGATSLNATLLLQYTDLLAGLIGEILTVRLMRAAWESGHTPVTDQDITP